VCAEFEKGYDIPFLLKKIEKSRLPSPDEKVRFSAVFIEYVTVLASAIKLHHVVPEREKWGMINGALASIPARSPIDIERFQEELARQEQAYLDKPLNTYIMVSNLSVEYFKGMRPIRLSDGLISFSGNLGPKFFRARKEIHQIETEFPRPLPPYSWVRIRVEARSSDEAADLALDHLDLIRAIWNFYLLHGSLRKSSGRASPLNDIVAGPVHTIHLPDGQLAVEGFWFEPSYIQSRHPKRLEDRWPEIKEFEIKTLRAIRKIPYRIAIEDALRRYGRALDMVDWDAATLKLWSVLESLTDTLRLPYEKTIRRISFIYKERAYNMQVLRHIRDYRNRTVHAEFSRKDKETILCQAKNYVGDLVLFHLRMGRQFKNLEEAGRFLELPTDSKMLERDQKLMKIALGFREH